MAKPNPLIGGEGSVSVAPGTDGVTSTALPPIPDWPPSLPALGGFCDPPSEVCARAGIPPAQPASNKIHNLWPKCHCPDVRETAELCGVGCAQLIAPATGGIVFIITERAEMLTGLRIGLV